MAQAICLKFIFIILVLFRAADSRIPRHMRGVTSIMKIHSKCRSGLYPRSQVKRFDIPDDKVPWEAVFPEYDPPVYNSNALKGKSWADPEIGASGFTPKWNSLDGLLSRVSFEGNYTIDNGVPLNPSGRTGIKGRGLLGRWGPNHAADPIVTRWKRGDNDDVINHPTTDKPILQLVVIQRSDNGEWALPGGMVDPGEQVSNTAMREFLEEAANSLNMTDDERNEVDLAFKDFFSKGEKVISSYVDDPRNTDNSWMETTAFSYHDEIGDVMKRAPLKAGDDAAAVKWIDIQRDMELYGTHKDFVEKVVHVKHCHW